jgi:flagellin
MTRINTNISSLVAQNILGRSNSALEQSLTRLSTGLRINTGKDDPAGLIASENLRSDITAIRKAIGNTDRANQVIATADSALGQVSSLLNDIRGLVTEAANSGAITPDQIAANQSQLDASLEALNRIAQTTTFQGRRLLDGSLGFITTAGTGFGTVSDLKIDQANLGATGQIAVNVDIATAATQAQITNGAIPVAVPAVSAQNATGDAAGAGFADAGVTGTLAIAAGSAFENAAGNNLTIEFDEDNLTTANTASLAGNVLTITVGTQGAGATIDLDTILQDLRDSSVAAFTSNIDYTDGDVTGDYTVGTDDGGAATITFSGGQDAVAASGGLDSDLVVEIAGATGAEVLSFGAGTSITLIVAAINAVSDATGVAATDNAGTLELQSTAYGSAAFVNVSILAGSDTSGTFAGGLSAPRATGTDIVAAVNGITANGDGNTLSINTATLDLTMAVDAGSSTDVSFTIDGGGALFQLGPDVVTNQQVRIGITSVNTARLGGVSGKLFQLGSGGSADLTTDPTTAAEIVEEAINQVTGLRGRLGAFQRTLLETNKNALSDTLVNLTDAESQIRDADFAAETAALTRAQILVQSGTTVLAITNQNPQNVLALLR